MDKIINFFKKNSRTWIAILIFFAASASYFSPALNGYTLKQHDIEGYNGMAKELRDYSQDHDDQALWTNSMFGGMPSYLVYFEKVNPIYSIYSFVGKILKYPISALFFACLSFFFLGRTLRTSYLISLLGALAYGFSAYHFLIIEAGHITKMMSIAFFPGILAGIVMVYRSNSYKLLIATGVLSLFFAIQIMTNHIQMTYYLILTALGFGVAELVKHLKEKQLKRFLIRTSIIVFAGLIGFSSNITNYYFLYNYSKKSMRGGSEITVTPNETVKKADTRTEEQKRYDEINSSSGLDRDYIVNWCYGMGETYNLLVPNAKGSNDIGTAIYEKMSKEDRVAFQKIYPEYQKSQGRLFGGYWGNQPGTSGPNYIGAILVFLALLYIIVVNSALKWSLLTVSLLAILLSWGKNLGGDIEHMWLTNFFIDYVPFYSKFRAVSTMLVVVNLSIPIMAILMLNKIFRDREWLEKNIKFILISAGVILGVILLVAVSPNSFFEFTSNAENAALDGMLDTFLAKGGTDPALIREGIVEARIGVFRSDSFRTIGFIVALLALLFLSYKNILKEKIVLISITVLAISDLWFHNLKFLNNDKEKNKISYVSWEKRDGVANIPLAGEGDFAIFQIESQENPELLKIANQRAREAQVKKGKGLTKQEMESIQFSTLNFNTNYRVMDVDNPWNSSRASYFHKSTGGYHPAKLRRYQDMIDFYISGEINYLNSGQLDKMKVLNMLNNKYYLYLNRQTKKRQLIAKNQYAFGNAWFVNDVKYVENNNEEILAIENTDVRNTAIVQNEFKDVIANTVSKDSNSSIIMDVYLPHYLKYTSNSSVRSLAVFSELYYKDGWNAYIDGEKVDHLRANYILRALPVPAGERMIEFKFEPTKVGLMNTVSVICFAIIVLLISLGFYFNNKTEKENG